MRAHFDGELWGLAVHPTGPEVGLQAVITALFRSLTVHQTLAPFRFTPSRLACPLSCPGRFTPTSGVAPFRGAKVVADRQGNEMFATVAFKSGQTLFFYVSLLGQKANDLLL